jgi:transcriptional regulator with GAF, ATPase, and Fis domain
MLGACQAMQDVFEKIDRIAPTQLTALILGETGTGKELAARALHRRSTRAAGPFVALNCGALPSSLLESELFGFEKGSFTGAVSSREGHIERAHGGTLFLDEIAELPPGAQSKLLRVLQDHRVQRLGAPRDRKVDIRVIAATHQDLPALVESRAFRRDLYHRLNEVQLQLPPLRERPGDVRLLVDAFLDRCGRELGRRPALTPAALDALESWSWPGNVRELENCIRRAVALAQSNTLDVADLHLRAIAAGHTLAQQVAAAEEQAIRSSLRRHAGDVRAAAAELDVPVDSLRELAARHAIPL